MVTSGVKSGVKPRVEVRCEAIVQKGLVWSLVCRLVQASGLKSGVQLSDVKLAANV